MSRLDKLLVELNLISTRSQAQDHIKSGRVLVNGKVVTKTGTKVLETDKIELKYIHDFVGRGALKAQAAVQEFSIKTNDITFLDVGASTGGFTDFLLSSGAKKAICVDVGTDQLHEKLRSDDRVEFYEETDIRKFETKVSFDLIIVDVSFISLTVILEKLIQLSHEQTEFIFLIKPQFEAGKKYLNKQGVVADEFHAHILEKLKKEFKESGLVTKGLISSPIKGKNGNQEYLIHLKR